jgi:hypothetical protein
MMRGRAPTRLLALAVVALLLADGAAWVNEQRHLATPVTLRHALQEYRREQRRLATAPTSTTATPAATAGAPSAARTVSASTPSPSPAASAPARSGPPRPGIYTYDTVGGEDLSLFGTSRTYPSKTYATLRREQGCNWTVEHPLLKEHVDLLGRCTDQNGVGISSDGSDVEFFTQTDGEHYRCDPPVVVAAWTDAGRVTAHETCHSSDSDAEFTVTPKGTMPMRVGSKTVRARLARIDVVLHGRVKGTVSVDAAVDETTGLLLRSNRIVDTDAHAVFGDVHYSERVLITLASLDPQQ